MRYLLFICLLLVSFSCSNTTNQERFIDSNKLTELISQKENTLVYVWTTWCSGCRETLAETLPRLTKDMDSSKYQILLIAASKNRAEVDSLVSSSGLQESSYLLNFIGPDKGKFQTLGIRQFLSSNFTGEKIYDGGIPVFFLVNRNGKVLQKKLPHSYDELISVLK